MSNFKLIILFLIVTVLIVSCKKNEEQKIDSVSNYEYKIVMSPDYKIKEIVYGTDDNVYYKSTIQYFDKTIEEDIYSNDNQLVESKVYYLNSGGFADSSIDNYTSSNYQRKSICKYQYLHDRLSEADYTVFSINEKNNDTTYSNSENFSTYVYTNDILTSGFNGQNYTFTTIPNKLSFDLLNIDKLYLGYSGNIGFNSSIIGKQEEFLVSTIQYYNSKDNVTKYDYSLNSDGLITEMRYKYPDFDYINFVIKNYEVIITFNYTIE